MGVIKNNKCSFCKIEEKKTQLITTFGSVFLPKPFGQIFVKMAKIQLWSCDKLKWNQSLLIFGCDNHGKKKMTMGLIFAKYFLFKCRFNITKPGFKLFMKYLVYQYKTDEYMVRVEMRHDTFIKQWLMYSKIFSQLWMFL